MKPEEHASHAENLLRTAHEFGTQNPMRASLERQAIAHATLALVPASVRVTPRKKPGPKPKTTKESKA